MNLFSRLSSIVALIIFAFTSFLIFKKLNADLTIFATCPNTDVLSWDANLRMLQTLDFRSDLQHGRILAAVSSIVSSPTWPPLHALIAATVFTFTGPSTIVDVYIGFAFYILTFILMLVSAVLIGRHTGLTLLHASGAFFFASICLIHSIELTAYGLSAMLETQGMFFLLLTCLAFFLHLKKRNPVLLSVATLGLFFTKYPYGHILIMALGGTLAVYHRQSLIPFIRFLWKRYAGLPMIFPGLLLLSVLFLIVARFIPGIAPNVKVFKYFFYGVTVLLWLDVSIYLFRKRAELSEVPSIWKDSYVLVIFPILFFTFLSPDRFSSTVGTQLHEQDSKRSFLLSLISDFTDSSVPMYGLIFLLLGATVLGFIRFRKQSRTEDSRIFSNPLLFSFVLILFHFLILEFLTSNKQLRHIYHLLPAFLIFAPMVVFHFLRDRALLSGAAQLILFFLSGLLLALPESILTSHYYNTRYFCWTGPAKVMFDPPRILVDQLDIKTNTILLNRLHEPEAGIPGRAFASDVDLLLRMKAMATAENPLVRNDSTYQWKSWKEFERVYYISTDCSQQLPDSLAKRLNRVAMQAKEEKRYAAPGLCLTQYRLSKIDEKQ